MAVLCASEGGSCAASLRSAWEDPCLLDLGNLKFNQIAPQGSLPRSCLTLLKGLVKGDSGLRA